MFEELVDEKGQALIDAHVAALGLPCAGSTSDVWSLSSCRESFGCLRGSFVLDGDMVAEVTGDPSYKGTIVDFSPVLGFSRFDETRHTGAALARWKSAISKERKLSGAFGLATEDGASNNKAANRILGQDMYVCTPHDVARSVLIACGESGKPCKNPELRDLIARSSKQSASFNRSVVANKALQEEQLKANPKMKAHQTLNTATKNTTRWLGLWEMCNRNRRVGPEIRIALTGEADGICAEVAAPPARAVRLTTDCSGSVSDGSGDDSGDDLEEGARAANKKFPLAHRCLLVADFKATEVFESLLDRAREVTLVCQEEHKGFGEGIDLGLNYLLLTAARDEACADRVEIVSGRGESEAWKEINGTTLAPMFKTFRKELAAQLTTRFNLDTTPSKHVLLALKMNPSVATGLDSPQFFGKSAKFELMEAEYTRAVRRHAIRKYGVATQPEAPAADSPAKADSPADSPADLPADSPAAHTPAPTPATEHATSPAAAGPAATTVAPPGKRRKGLLGAVVAQQGALRCTGTADWMSKIDLIVKAEVDQFEMITLKTLAKVRSTRTCPPTRPPARARCQSSRSPPAPPSSPISLSPSAHRAWTMCTSAAALASTCASFGPSTRPRCRCTTRCTSPRWAASVRLPPTWSRCSQAPASSPRRPRVWARCCSSARSSCTTIGSTRSSVPPSTRCACATSSSSTEWPRPWLPLLM